MIDKNDWSASDKSFGWSDTEPINHDLEEMGFSLAPDGNLIWEEALDYDPDSEWCRTAEVRVKALDDAFLKSCGVKGSTHE